MYFEPFYIYIWPIFETRCLESQTMPHITALVHGQCLASSITLPLEILSAAAQSQRSQAHRTHLSVSLISENGGALATHSGVEIATEETAAFKDPDLLIIPAIWRSPRHVLRKERWQLPLIVSAARAGAQIASVGSGSFLLAEAGLLGGQVATTHWQWFDLFSKLYPQVTLRRDQPITQSGRFYCAGSVNSMADLVVYLCSELFSPSIARRIENQFSPEIRRRFQPSPLAARNDSHRDETILDIQLNMMDRLQQPISTRELAHEMGLSVRTLNRRFRQATGMTPLQYLTEQRIDEARQLLLHTNLAITDIALRVGMRDASNFARMFRQSTGVSPRKFRHAVRGKAFTPASTHTSNSSG